MGSRNETADPALRKALETILIDPNADVKKIIERTIRQEIEKKKLKLERLLSSDELGKDEEIEILFIESVINDLLPELEAILKRNC